jgi:hypothetical protein
MKLEIYPVAALALLAGPVLGAGRRLGEIGRSHHRQLGSGGSYSIDFAAANPDDYIPYVPMPADCAPIVGRGDGSLVIPMADFSDGSADVKVESLMPPDMVMGQIVPFVIKISVSGDVESGNIQFEAGWSTMTTSNKDFGYEYTNYGVYAAFVDTSDGAHNDPGGDATVSSFSWDASVGDEILGTFDISGLDDGDEVVVEVWVVLRDWAASNANGNVHSGMVVGGAHTEEGDEINVGQQTIPVMLGGNSFSTNVDFDTAFRVALVGDTLCD